MSIFRQELFLICTDLGNTQNLECELQYFVLSLQRSLMMFNIFNLLIFNVMDIKNADDQK